MAKITNDQLSKYTNAAIQTAGLVLDWTQSPDEIAPSIMGQASTKAGLLSGMSGYQRQAAQQKNIGSAIVSGAATGAGIGTTINAGIGTVVGGVVGAIGGAASSLFYNANAREEARQAHEGALAQFRGINAGLSQSAVQNALTNYAAMGGQLSTQGGNFKTGLEVFGNGGKHEENPNGGIPQGVDSQGVPNTVEEGETKFQNYIFSNREVVDKDLQKGLGLSGRLSGKTFAQASKMINKSREERPNDVIANRTADAQLNTLRNLQEETKQVKQQVDMAVNQAASGGQLNVSKSNTKAAYNNTGASEDLAFQTWYSKNTLEGQNNIPYSDKLNYDYYSFYKNGDYKNPDYNIDSHFPDTYKRTSHPTFSNESIYSTPEKPGGSWMQDTYKQNGRFMYASGGSIHIDPSKKGTFTAAATKHDMGVQAFARKVLANKENYSSTMVKKANFARNVANWHDAGGPLADSEEELLRKDILASRRAPVVPIPEVASSIQIPVQSQTADPIKIAALNQQAINQQNYRSDVEGPEWSTLGMMAPAVANLGEYLNLSRSKVQSPIFGRVAVSDRLNENFPVTRLPWDMVANDIQANTAATRANLINTSGGNASMAQAAQLMLNRQATDQLGQARQNTALTNAQLFREALAASNAAKASNIQMDMGAQQANLAARMQENDLFQRALANKGNLISGARNAIAGNISEIAKFERNRKLIGNMFNYNDLAEYMKNKK